MLIAAFIGTCVAHSEKHTVDEANAVYDSLLCGKHPDLTIRATGEKFVLEQHGEEPNHGDICRGARYSNIINMFSMSIS